MSMDKHHRVFSDKCLSRPSSLSLISAVGLDAALSSTESLARRRRDTQRHHFCYPRLNPLESTLLHRNGSGPLVAALAKPRLKRHRRRLDFSAAVDTNQCPAYQAPPGENSPCGATSSVDSGETFRYAASHQGQLDDHRSISAAVSARGFADHWVEHTQNRLQSHDDLWTSQSTAPGNRTFETVVTEG